MRSNLSIITTGGTIDKKYPRHALAREMEMEGAPAAIDILSKAAPGIAVSIRALFAVDSLDMTEDQREAIAASCASAEETCIVITHGTDRLADTARYLSGHPGCSRKTVVLTGASRPACVRDTDAEFNVGLAVGVALTAPSGVYIAIQGKVFPEGKCRKNPGTGVFEADK